MQYILGHSWLTILLIFVALFLLLVIGLIIGRGTTKRLVKDLGLARHILVSWFIVPIFRLFYRFLEETGKIEITVDSPIPWGEKRLIFVGNHAMPKLQDTFLMPVIIFFRNPGNLTNPIRYFPFTIADDANFVKDKLFKNIVGAESLEPADRTPLGKVRSRDFLDIWKKRLTEISVWLIANIEGGRTQSAKTWLTSAGGNRLGTPTRGLSVLALETGTTIVPYWGSIVKVSRPKNISSLFTFLVQLYFWKFLELIFKRHWQELGFYTTRPKACSETVLWGLLELLLNPEIKAYIDINHPQGPIVPETVQESSLREASQKLTSKIAQTLLEIGDLQSTRIKKG